MLETSRDEETLREHLRMQQFFHNFSTIAAIFHPYVFFFLANNDDCSFFAKTTMIVVFLPKQWWLLFFAKTTIIAVFAKRCLKKQPWLCAANIKILPSAAVSKYLWEESHVKRSSFTQISFFHYRQYWEMIKMLNRILDEFSSLWKCSNKSLASAAQSPSGAKNHISIEEVEDFLKFLNILPQGLLWFLKIFQNIIRYRCIQTVNFNSTIL